MSKPPHLALRRRLAVLLVGVLGLLGGEVALPASSVAPGAVTAVADTGSPLDYDRSLRAFECGLLGRVHATGLGCARTRCVEGAMPWRKVRGAEACALAGQPRGYGFGATVDVRRCRALHRRWIAAVNYCAAQPDRSLTLVVDAPQCVAPATVYVTLAEDEAHADECLTRARATELARLAASHDVTLADEVALRSPAQCQERPGHAYLAGRCTRRPGRRPGGGGVLMVGDSVTWRGSDELTRLRPGFTLDAEPGRRPSELASRLAVFRARHGTPAGLVVELGTNSAPDFGRAELAAVVGSLPARTQVMFVLPYLGVAGDRTVPSAPVQRFGSWMRSLAATRGASCVADWPAYVRTHPGLLQDGIHTQNAAEGDWARWISAQWGRCSQPRAELPST